MAWARFLTWFWAEKMYTELHPCSDGGGRAAGLQRLLQRRPGGRGGAGPDGGQLRGGGRYVAAGSTSAVVGGESLNHVRNGREEEPLLRLSFRTQ